MIVHAYAYKDIQVGAFQPPFFRTEEEEVVKISIARTVAIMPKEDVVKGRVNDLDLYYIGDYDDETGRFVSAVRFILHLDQYIKKEDIKDEQSVQSGSSKEA